MNTKKDKQSEVASAWAIAVLQNNNNLSDGGPERLEFYSKEIINEITTNTPTVFRFF